jgi:hypothetical protein
MDTGLHDPQVGRAIPAEAGTYRGQDPHQVIGM